MPLLVFAGLLTFGVTLCIKGHKGWGWTMIVVSVLVGLGGLVLML